MVWGARASRQQSGGFTVMYEWGVMLATYMWWPGTGLRWKGGGA